MSKKKELELGDEIFWIGQETNIDIYCSKVIGIMTQVGPNKFVRRFEIAQNNYQPQEVCFKSKAKLRAALIKMIDSELRNLGGKNDY